MPEEIKVPTSWESVAVMDPIDIAELLDKKDAEIDRLRTVLNRIANGTRLPSDDVQKAMHKAATDVLGDAYQPFPLQF